MRAFPTSSDNGHTENQDGMKLRDYFAAKAMEANISALALHWYSEGIEMTPEKISSWAYIQADSMMKAREL